MKEFLENILPVGLWNLFRRLWRYAVGVNDAIVSNLAALLVVILGALSRRFLVAVKERIKVIVRMDYNPEVIYLNVDSVIEYGTRRNSCKKEPETVRWIEDHINPGDVFYDIGANVGAYSFIAARRTNGRVKIYAFEPSYSTFAQLNENIIVNSLQDSIVPFCFALSSKTEISVLNYSSLSPGAALHALGQPQDALRRTFKPVFEQKIISYRIDDLVGFFQIDKPTHIKIDVDGNELEILAGAEETLRHPGLKSILVEVEPSMETSAQIVEFLQDRGFRHQLTKGHGMTRTSTTNYLFVRS